MAGTVTVTEVTHEPIKRIKLAWTSDASGDADGSTTNYYTGKLIGAVTIPDGTDAPTASYDIELLDDEGVDLFSGAKADLSAVNTEYAAESELGAAVATKLTISVTNAGNAKKGVAYVYLR